MRGQFAHPDPVAGGKAGHTGGGHQHRLGKALPDRIAQKCLFPGPVKGFYNQVIAGQLLGDIFRRQPQDPGHQLCVGGNPPQARHQGLRLVLAQLVHKIQLPVEIGGFHPVVVHQP